jgi:hypothetical protein
MGRTTLSQLVARSERDDPRPVIVTWNVVEYRKAAERYVTKDDVVLEVRNHNQMQVSGLSPPLLRARKAPWDVTLYLGVRMHIPKRMRTDTHGQTCL